MGPNASAARSVQPFAPRKWGGSGTEAAARADSSNARSRAPSPLGADPHLPSYSLVKQPSSFPRRVFCARGLLLLRAPGMRGGRSAERASGACEAPVRRVRTRQALVRRLASLVRGTLASRRSTVAILGSGPALPSPDLHPDRSQRAPRIRVIVPGGRGPGASRGERLPAARRGTPLLAPSSRRCSRRHPSGARMDVDVASARYAVKRKLYEMCCCSKNVRKDYWRQ